MSLEALQAVDDTLPRVAAVDVRGVRFGSWQPRRRRAGQTRACGRPSGGRRLSRSRGWPRGARGAGARPQLVDEAAVGGTRCSRSRRRSTSGQLVGHRPGCGRKVPCPFHYDERPSLHVYAAPERGWNGYSCRRGGSIYDLAAETWGMGTRGREFIELRRRRLEGFCDRGRAAREAGGVRPNGHAIGGHAGCGAIRAHAQLVRASTTCSATAPTLGRWAARGRRGEEGLAKHARGRVDRADG